MLQSFLSVPLCSCQDTTTDFVSVPCLCSVCSTSTDGPELCFSLAMVTSGGGGAKLIPAMVGNTASEERQSAKGGNRQHVKEQLVGCGCVPGRHKRNVNVDSVG